MKRVSGLDGVRGVAILWVLFYHLYALVPKAPGLVAVPGIGRVAELGWIGVSLFFTLSGYLIIPMLADEKGAPNFFARFGCRRLFRLVPLYVVLLLSFLLASACWKADGAEHSRLFDRSIPFWSYWLFAQNLPMASQGLLGNEWLRVTWSLAVEVQFYALIAVVVYLVPRDALGRWLGLLIVAAVGFRFAVVFLNPGATTPLVVLLPSRLDAFLVGGFAGLWAPRALAAGVGRRQVIDWGVLTVALLTFVLFAAGWFGSASRFVLPLYHLALALGAAALIDLAVLAAPVRSLMESRLLVRAGRVSYFLYLFHLPVVWIVYRGLFGMSPTLETSRGVGIMVGALVVLILLAELSWHFFESPLIRQSHGFFPRPKRNPISR